MNPEKKKILMVAGEASGDLHGSGVIKALKGLNPELRVWAMGSRYMRSAGAEILFDSSRLAVVGITEVFGQIGNLVKAYRGLKNFIRKNRPELLILIDFPDFNLRLARIAKSAGVPVLYYISPQVWAWRPGRVQKIAERVTKMAVILPFETSIYRQAGLEAEFVGHPLLDIMNGPGPGFFSHGYKEWKGNPLIALLPGSRAKEIKTLLPEMVKAAGIILARKPEAQFILPLAPTLAAEEINAFLRSQPVPIAVVEGQTYGVIRAADLAIVASGTATLETSILQKPMVVVYQVSPLSYWIGKALIKVSWVGLVNIIAGRQVVPELLQNDAKAERIAAEALRILDEENYRAEMLQGLAEVKGKLGTPGASQRVAKMALEMIDKNQ